MAKSLENTIAELQHKCDDSNRNVNDLNTQKAKMQAENANIIQQLEDVEHQCSAITKERNAMQSQLDEMRAALEEETRVIIFKLLFICLKQIISNWRIHIFLNQYIKSSLLKSSIPKSFINSCSVMFDFCV